MHRTSKFFFAANFCFLLAIATGCGQGNGAAGSSTTPGLAEPGSIVLRAAYLLDGLGERLADRDTSLWSTV